MGGRDTNCKNICLKDHGKTSSSTSGHSSDISNQQNKIYTGSGNNDIRLQSNVNDYDNQKRNSSDNNDCQSNLDNEKYSGDDQFKNKQRGVNPNNEQTLLSSGCQLHDFNQRTYYDAKRDKWKNHKSSTNKNNNNSSCVVDGTRHDNNFETNGTHGSELSMNSSHSGSDVFSCSTNSSETQSSFNYSSCAVTEENLLLHHHHHQLKTTTTSDNTSENVLLYADENASSQMALIEIKNQNRRVGCSTGPTSNSEHNSNLPGSGEYAIFDK